MKETPSVDLWLKDAKNDESSAKCGMYLVHNGTVRIDTKAKVRMNENDNRQVIAMDFSYDEDKVNALIAKTYLMPGIYYVRVWLNEGILNCGDDIMLILIGGDIRPHVVDALQFLVGEIKDNCVKETELFEEG